MSVGGNETAAPVWGALPVEQYLIRKWDRSSELSADDQRAELVAAYIDEDVLDAELFASPPTRTPTAVEIAEILEPWRPQKLRRLAAHYQAGPDRECHYFIFLRTCYTGGAGGDDDAKLRRWLDLYKDEPIYPEGCDGWCHVLDDARLFDVGDSWQDVYGVLPELAAREADRRFTDDDVERARELAGEGIESEPHVPEEDHWEDAIMQAAATGMPPWLLVLDEEAFKSEELGLVFLDKKGNTVRETEIQPDMLGDFYMRVDRGIAYAGYFEHARPGYKYRPWGKKGKIMRRLLPLARGE